jgi:hypothetical protein
MSLLYPEGIDEKKLGFPIKKRTRILKTTPFWTSLNSKYSMNSGHHDHNKVVY